MSYWGLFWETGMPAVWALSRKSGDGLESDMGVQTQSWAAMDQRMCAEGTWPGETGQFYSEQTGGSGEKQ